MKMRFVLKGETHPGAILTIRRFKTREAAEEHPVLMKYWKRVWVEEDTAPEPPVLDYAPPLPWSVEWVHTFTYVRDAENNRIMTLYGPMKRREHLERMLREAGLVG